MVTFYALSYAVASPVIGAAAAHWPRKRLLLVGLAIFVLGNVASALAPAWYVRDIPIPPAISLGRRFAPLADARVLRTLLTVWLANSGFFLVYTVGSTLDRATGGDARVLPLYGLAATLGNLVAGRLTDRFGSRPIINVALIIVALNFALLPWTSTSLATAAPALVIWGFCCWGQAAPQQHRLISIAPTAAPLLLGLNSAVIYVGVSMSGLIGGAAITWFDPYALGFVGAAFVAAALVVGGRVGAPEHRATAIRSRQARPAGGSFDERSRRRARVI